MDLLRIVLFLCVGIFGVYHGVKNGQNLYVYAGILLALVGLFSIYVGWKQKRDK